MLVGLSINLKRTKNKIDNNNCGKIEGNISNRIGNEGFKTKEMPLTNFDYIQSKSFNNNCSKKNGNIKYKTDNEKLKTEKKLGLDNLKDLR